MNDGQSSQILTCIVDGMRSDRPPAIRGAAARALINSLDFTRSNFEVQQERDVIMQVCRCACVLAGEVSCWRSFFVVAVAVSVAGGGGGDDGRFSPR